MGILAGCLNRLLRRVREDAERERIRAAQEKEQWHAVGHEIMSPLQSLLALHGKLDDPDYRYLARMRQALRILYGSANPGEALQSSTLEVSTLDLDAFLTNVAANAHHAGIDEVRYQGRGEALRIYADEYALEDVMGHLLKNAARHRAPGTPIVLSLDAGETSATVRVRNPGAPIATEWREKIFEYGFSGKAENGGGGRSGGDECEEEHRGQGLFVAKTYLAKMGGTIRAENEADGVTFCLELLRADEREI
jgi:signal transduction histidine kinase